MQKKQNYSSPYQLEGRIPLGQAILYGLQHVMAMFVGNLTPVLLITGACALDGGTSASNHSKCDADGRAYHTVTRFLQSDRLAQSFLL